jgi:hypothetical protein
MSLENYPASDETKEHARQLVKTALAFHSAAAQVAGQAERFDAIAAVGQRSASYLSTSLCQRKCSPPSS